MEKSTEAGDTGKNETDDLNSSEDSDSQVCLSDDEDIFDMKVCPEINLSTGYKKSFGYQNSRAVSQVANLLRDDPLVPLSSHGNMDHLMDVQDPLLWPKWHCPFKNCTVHGNCQPCMEPKVVTSQKILSTDNYIKALWSHVWGAENFSELGKHRHDLGAVVRLHLSSYLESSNPQSTREWAFSILQEAIAMKCREKMEIVGVARDRRALLHVEEVFTEPNCKVLMCFVCNTKHVYYHNFDKFGNEYNAGRIDYRNKSEDRKVLSRLLPTNKDGENFFTMNLCAKRFRNNYGAAIEKDPHGVRENSNEWRRTLFSQADATDKECICNPEDVLPSENCKHNVDSGVCMNCNIPICNECWRHTLKIENIPKAIANDNFVGYMHKYFLKHSVTWIEATIASPIFSGMVTYYIEGERADRHHLMEQNVAQPRLSYGVRGNIYSCLLKWEDVQKQLSNFLASENPWEWPLSPMQVSHAVRIRIHNTQASITEKFRELKARSKIVREVAHLYIENHMADLLKIPGARLIHSKMQAASPAESIRKHVDSRVNKFYPEADFPMPQGAVPTVLMELVKEQEAKENKRVHQSAFSFKQSTMTDASSTAYDTLFSTVRPSLVVDEASVESILPQDTKIEHALKAVAVVDLNVTNKFEDQWIPQYMSRIFPWVLNYSCGGAEYPGLFDKAAWQATDEHDPVAIGVTNCSVAICVNL